MKRSRSQRRLATLAVALSFLSSMTHAQSEGPSNELSALSTLPVAISVAIPVGVLSGAAAFTVVSVTAAAEGTVWVLERISDGVRVTLRFAGQAVVASGTAISLTVIASGAIVVTAAGQVIAFVPNERSRGLLFNERLTR